MNKWCPNCGRPMDEFELGFGPGALGCIYCTTTCPNCGREIFDTDIIYGEEKVHCKYCHAEVETEAVAAEEQADQQIFGDEAPDDIPEDSAKIDEEALDEFSGMSQADLDALGEALETKIQDLYGDILRDLQK